MNRLRILGAAFQLTIVIQLGSTSGQMEEGGKSSIKSPISIDARAESLREQFRQTFNNGLYERAIELAREALKLQELADNRDPTNLCTSLGMLATVYVGSDRYSDAEPLLVRAKRHIDDSRLPVSPLSALVHFDLARCKEHARKYEQAISLMDEAEKILEKFAQAEKTPGKATANLAMMLRFHAKTSSQLNKYHEAELLYRRIIAFTDRGLQIDPTLMALMLSELGTSLRVQAKNDEAILFCRRATTLAEKSANFDKAAVGLILGRYADTIANTEPKEAETVYLRALDAWKGQPADQFNSARTYYMLAKTYLQTERHELATATAKKALELLVNGQSDPENFDITSGALIVLSYSECQLEKFIDAEEHIRQVEKLWRERMPLSSSPRVISYLFAKAYWGQNKYAEAYTALTTHFKSSPQKGEDPLQEPLALALMSVICQKLDKMSEAASFLERANQRAAALKTDSGNNCGFLRLLASSYTMAKRFDAAEQLTRRALAMGERLYGPMSQLLLQDIKNLAALCEIRGDNAEAAKLRERAAALERSGESPFKSP